MEQGESSRAKEALMAYQSAARLIAEETGGDVAKMENISSYVIVNNQKALMAALPGDAQIGIISETLNRTEEFFTSDLIEREQVRLQNAGERLLLIQDMIGSGHIEAAKEMLVHQELSSSNLLAELDQVEDEEEKKVLLNMFLEARNDELRLLADISDSLKAKSVADNQLVAMLESVGSDTKNEILKAVELITPFEPDVVLKAISLNPLDEKAQIFAEKVNIYSSYTGQKNQISRLLKNNPDSRDMGYLVKIRDQLSGRPRDVMNVRILELEREMKVQKDREVRRKIEQAKKMRE